MKSIWKFLVLFLFLVLLLTGCASNDSALASKVGSISEEQMQKTTAGENMYFVIPVDQKMLDSGQTISIRTSGKIDTGRLRIVLRDPEGKIAWDPGAFGGEFSANTFYKPERTGTYHLGAAWDGPTTGKYSLSFQAESLTASALVPGLGMMVVAIGFIVFGLWGGARKIGTWSYLGLGAVAWIVTVVIKFVIAIPGNGPIYKALFVPGALFAPGSILFYLYVGLLTGVTEVLLTWLLLRYTTLGEASWHKALAFGVGFGAIEALLLGFTSFATMIVALTAPQSLPASTMGSLLGANNLLLGLAPIVERIATILVHILCNVLLFYGAVTKQGRWFWASFAWKSGLDAIAGFAQMWGVASMSHLWTIEAIIIVFGVLSYLGIRAIARRYPVETASAAVVPVPVAGE